MITHEKMFNALSQKLCRVTFTKVNGDLRVMDCTRVLERIPMDMRPKGDDTIAGNDSVIKVFDIKAQGWRSFKVDKVTNFEEIGNG